MQISIINDNLVTNDKKGNLAMLSKVVNVKDLKSFAGIALNHHICCGIFRENVRRIDHFEKIHFLQFDFDDGTQYEDVVKSFPLENMVILASKSHMVDKKNGKGPIPRFHVFLPLKTPIVNAEFYTFLIKYLAKRQKISIDRKAIDSTRYYFKHSKFLYGKLSGENLDPTIYYDNFEKEKKELETKRRMQEKRLEELNKDNDLTADERKEAAKILIALRVKESIAGQEGNNNTFIATCYAVRFGLTDHQIYDVLDWYNNNYCKPKWTKRELDNKVKYAKMKVDYSEYFSPRYIKKILDENSMKGFYQ